MSFHLSRPTTPASSIKGLGPFRTPRSRPGQQSSQSRFGSLLSYDSRPVSRTSTRQHRRSTSLPVNQPTATPKSQGTLHIDRHQRETTSRASSPPISGSYISRPGHSIRSSLQSLARSGSFSLPKTPKGKRSTETPDLIEDDGDHSDGSRFDLLPADPFGSDSPFVISDIEEVPPLPPKPLFIPLSPLIIPSDPVNAPTPVSEGSRTPVVDTMRSALNRVTMTSRPRLRLLSFIKETKSPISAVEPEPEPEPSPPQLQLPNFQMGPLFDVSAFQLQEIPVNRRSIRVEGPSLGHAAPPPLRIPPPPPNAPPLGTLPGPSALQLDLNGEFEGYILEESPTESQQANEIIQPPTPKDAPKSPDDVPNWIHAFRKELEDLAGEALSITRLSDKLVLELPKEPGLSHRRTLIFQDGDVEESTPELTSDTISVSSRGRPPRPTRPPPPIPQEFAPEGSGGDSKLAEHTYTWSPRSHREACASLLSINSGSSFDPSQPIPSIPDFDSSYLSSDDDHTIRAAAAGAQPHIFQPSLSKQEAIEEAIRKIQRKAEGSRLLVIKEDESDLESEASEEPVVVERGPTLIRHISNPFASPPSPEPSKPRKVSLLRKRVLSRSLGSPKPTESAHSRSASSLPTTSEILKEKNIIVAGRLPLNNRGIERDLPSIPASIAQKHRQPVEYDNFYSAYRPVYLAESTPTFEVVPSPTRGRSFEVPAVYYPKGPTPLPHPTSSTQSSEFFSGFMATDYNGAWEPETDYTGHQWFTNLPPKAKTPPPEPSPKPTYIPEPAVVDRNALFVYALKSAPDVLMEQYKHFGQLGVLGWCSDFSEMIDELKEFGSHGHMFTDTRDQALETCTYLLDALVNRMEVRMQIIVMFLSFQVQRLRKFLDASTEFDDYPQPEFMHFANR